MHVVLPHEHISTILPRYIRCVVRTIIRHNYAFEFVLRVVLRGDTLKQLWEEQFLIMGGNNNPKSTFPARGYFDYIFDQHLSGHQTHAIQYITPDIQADNGE